VAEVEDVAGVGAVGVEHLAGFGGDGFGAAEQHGRVEVALQRDLVADQAPGGADVHRPVEADCVGAAVGDVGQPQAAALGEHDARDALAVLLAGEAGDDLADVGEENSR
jgi:hypothetical protein